MLTFRNFVLATMGLVAAGTAAAQAPKPLEMKLLVLCIDGNEPSCQAMKELLQYVGTPYQAVHRSTQPLPALSSNGQGLYQGIVLSIGNLGGTLTAEDWTNIETYMRDYKVRLASFYTFPEPRYGITFVSALSTTPEAPGNVGVLSAGKSVFPYLREGPYKVTGSYVYLATATPAAGEITTPLLTMNSRVVGARHTKADGREYLALTMDQAPYLLHSMAFHYGLINWVTRGVFLGYRRTLLTPQNDDIFLSSDLFVAGNAACSPSGAAFDPTYNAGTVCPTLRMNGADLLSLADWQDRVRRNGQFRFFKVAHAYNGFGTTAGAGFGGPNDSLSLTAKAFRLRFNWLSHTYNHENLDCYLPANSGGTCVSVSPSQAATEIQLNKTMAASFGLSDDSQSMVTPAISGLNNPTFMQAFVNAGMRYVVTDMSRPGHSPAVPNTAILNWQQPSVIMVPRRATNIFYNTSTPIVGAAGSQTDEYNHLFGPSGIFRLPSGAPFFSTNQTYAQIVDREAEAIVTYMMRGEMYPLMFHQANFFRHNGSRSLFTDLMDAVMAKYSRLSTLTVSSLKQSTLGQRLKERLDYSAAGVRGVYTPGVSISLTSLNSAIVPVTGFCQGSCEAVYNGQRQDRVPVTPGQTLVIPFNSSWPGFDMLGEDQ